MNHYSLPYNTYDYTTKPKLYKDACDRELGFATRFVFLCGRIAISVYRSVLTVGLIKSICLCTSSWALSSLRGISLCP